MPSLRLALGQQFPGAPGGHPSARCAELGLRGFVGAALGWLKVAFAGFAGRVPGTFPVGSSAWVGLSPCLLALKSPGCTFNHCSKL